MRTCNTMPTRASVALIVFIAAAEPAPAAVYDVQVPLGLYGDLNQTDVPVIGEYACGPTAATNGLIYLQSAFPRNYDGSLVPIQDQDLDGDGDCDSYDDMIVTALILAGSDYFDTVQTQCSWPDNYIWGKNRYIEQLASAVTVYEAQNQWDWDNHPPQPAWVTQQPPTWTFVYEGLLDGADVEVLLSFAGYPDGYGHWVTVNGFHWDDANDNGVIEQTEEALIDFVDSLGGTASSVSIWHEDSLIRTDYPIGGATWISAAFLATPVYIPLDCNENGIPDECDLDCGLTGGDCDMPGCGSSSDGNGDGRPDECCLLASAPQLQDPIVPKSRYLSFTAGDPGEQAALRLTMVRLPELFGAFRSQTMWVGPPSEYCENAGQVTPPPSGCGPAPGLDSLTFVAATLQCEPYYTDWSTYGAVHIRDEAVIPDGTYHLQAIHEACNTAVEQDYSAPLAIDTSIWGDVVRNCIVTPCSPPDGTVGVTTDVTAILDKFKNLPGAITKARADLEPTLPDLKINIADVTYCLDAFRGFSYPFPGPSPCP